MLLSVLVGTGGSAGVDESGTDGGTTTLSLPSEAVTCPGGGGSAWWRCT